MLNAIPSGDLHSDSIQWQCRVVSASKISLAAYPRKQMNINTLNRTVLAALIGSALAVGLSAPSSARARPPQDAVQQTTAEEDAREARKRQRQSDKEDREARSDAAPARAPVIEARPREQDRPRVIDNDVAERRQQDALRQRQSEQREQQAELREQQVERDRTRRDRDESGERERRAVAEQLERRQAAESRELRAQRESQAQQRAAQREAREDRVERTDRTDRAQQADRTPRTDRVDRDGVRGDANLRPARRLPDRQRDVRITQQRRQAQQYQQVIQAQQPVARQYAETLRHQNRHSQYRYQQQYYRRLLEMLARYQWQNYNYYNDPYFYTADDYRYYRGGSYYSINRYGADTLRQAINFGYQEGFYAGRADRQDSWRFDYRNAYPYRDANFGYRGFYVSQREYNYYFREGFRRGYEDGYYGRRRYGQMRNGNDAMLGTVLSVILNLQQNRY